MKIKNKYYQWLRNNISVRVFYLIAALILFQKITSGQNVTSSSNTSDYIPKYIGTNQIGNSQIYDAGAGVILGKNITLGTRTNSTGFNGNTSGLSINNVAEIRGADYDNPPALTWHYENRATRHIILDGSGRMNVVSPSGENGGVAIFQVNGNDVLHLGNYYSYVLPLSGGNITGLIKGTDAQFSGNLGIGTNNPDQKLTIKGGGIGFDGNSGDKKLYAPTDGVLEWMTHDYASEHAFAVSHQGQKRVYLNTNGNSYFNGGNVGIGTSSPTEKLSVNGNIRSKKLIVTQNGWADYVFNDEYYLRPLTQVERFIKENKHLPDMPTAKEVAKEGVDIGATQALLLKKIEELTLYIIEIKKEDEQTKKDNELLKKRIEKIENKK
jgi:hypothetical protein